MCVEVCVDHSHTHTLIHKTQQHSGYWLLRSLKDSVMVSLNGVEYIPQAKMVSLVVVTALVFVYNK